MITVYVLIWVIFAGGGANNVAATGSAEFTTLEACQQAGNEIVSRVNKIGYIKAIAMCQPKK